MGYDKPSQYANYFVVIDGDEPFYNVHEYNALWVLPFGFLSVVPF